MEKKKVEIYNTNCRSVMCKNRWLEIQQEMFYIEMKRNLIENYNNSVPNMIKAINDYVRELDKYEKDEESEVHYCHECLVYDFKESTQEQVQNMKMISELYKVANENLFHECSETSISKYNKEMFTKLKELFTQYEHVISEVEKYYL